MIGGQDQSLRYLDDVELLAPGFDCSEQEEMKPFPIRIKWAAAAFINGQTIGTLPFATFFKQHEIVFFMCRENIEKSSFLNSKPNF